MNTLKSIVNLIVNLLAKKHPTGVLTDLRPPEERERDYLHEERSVGSGVAPFMNAKITQSPYFYENQNYTQSCVMHAMTLAFLIVTGCDRLSKMYSYRQRSNFPATGMWPQQGAQLLKDQGAPKYETLPTPFNEADANKILITKEMVDEARALADKIRYFTMSDPKDFNEIARVSDLGNPVAITIYATEKEWSKEYPTVDGPLASATAPVRHEICVLPHSSFTENDTPYITVQDSAWFGGKKLRHLSHEFIMNRCYNALYIVKKPEATQKEKPSHAFSGVTLKVGTVSREVVWLQRVLNYEGLIEDDCVTGNFFGRTLAAVKALQAKHAQEILAPIGLTEPTGIVGPSTIAWLNRNYS